MTISYEGIQDFRLHGKHKARLHACRVNVERGRRCLRSHTLQLLHLLLAARDVHVGALPLVVNLLQARAVLTEGRLNLQLLLDGGICQLQPKGSPSSPRHCDWIHSVLNLMRWDCCCNKCMTLRHALLLECRLHLGSIFWVYSTICDCGIYLSTVALHLCSCPEGALQATRGILDFL